jgi:integrase
MTKEKTNLTDKRVKAAPPGRYYDGRGLILKVRETGSRDWTLRITVAGKTTDYGLGGYPDLSLAAAREKAYEMRRLIKQGKELPPRKPLKVERKTFADFVTTFIENNQSLWKSPKSAPQFLSSMTAYAYPVIGTKTPKEVTREDLLSILTPIWLTKMETASRVQTRIASVLDYAAIIENETGRDNPAKLRPYLINVLPTRPKKTTVKHHAAMPYADLPGFWRELASMEGMGAAALRWTILTAARSGETRGAAWEEIGSDGLWNIPAERMKADKAHNVFITPPARACLPDGAAGLIFPAVRGGMLSDMTLAAVLKRMDYGQYTVHGFRSSFRDWAANETHFPREVAEKCLAHALADKVEAAYFRSTLPEKRAALLTAWAAFVTGDANA